MSNQSDSEIAKYENVYSPSTLLGVYANALRTSVDGKILLAKGVFVKSQFEKEYSGYYYDSIKSLNDNISIKTKISSLLRSKLQNNKIYLFKGYVEKKISFSTIELVLVVDDISDEEQQQVSEIEIKRFELIQRKNNKEYRNIEGKVKESVYKNIPLKIANLFGNTAIVDDDFKLGIADASIKFQISDFRCSFSSKKELIDKIYELNKLDFDVVALVRGGGDKSSFEIFNDPELGNALINIKPIFVTALGHTVNDTLIDKIADKKFALPHDYGNSLKVWIDQATEEQANSKSIFIDQVKKDLTKTFLEQITTLQKQLETKNKEFETAQVKFKEMVEQNQKEKNETILAKEKAFEANVKTFEANIKTLTEQIKAKEENLKIIQANNETSTKQQIALLVAQNNTEKERLNSEKVSLSNQITYLTQQIENLSKKNGKVTIYIMIAIIIGLIIGLILNINK